MVTAKQVINSIKPNLTKAPPGPTKQGSAGYDNVRDDIEKTKSLREAGIDKLAVDHIAEKTAGHNVVVDNDLVGEDITGRDIYTKDGFQFRGLGKLYISTEDEIIFRSGGSTDRAEIDTTGDWDFKTHDLTTTGSLSVGDLSTLTIGKSITNGDFSSGSTGWTVGGDWTTTGNIATFTRDAAGTSDLVSLYTVVTGKFYKVTFDYTQAAGGKTIDVSLGGAAAVNYEAGETGSYTLFFKAINTTGLTFRGNGAGPPGLDATIDNVTITEYGGITAVAELPGLYITNYLSLADDAIFDIGEDAVINIGTEDGPGTLGASAKVWADSSGILNLQFAGQLFNDNPSLHISAGTQSGVSSNAITITTTQTGNEDVINFELEKIFLKDTAAKLTIGASGSINTTIAQVGNDTVITKIGGTAGLLIRPGTHMEIGDATNYVNIDTNGNTYWVGSGAGLPYADICFHDESTAQSIPTGAGYTKFTAWTTDNLSNNCTADASNDKITITKTGVYKIDCSISAEIGTANVNFMAAIFWNAVEQDCIHWRRNFGTANDEGAMSMTGYVDVTSVPTDIDVRVRHDNGGNVNFTGTYGNLNVMQVGGT